MTNPTNQSNGASLEDCHTNFFALTDLCGIKWRKVVWGDWNEGGGGGGGGGGPNAGGGGNVGEGGVLEDPVLNAYVRCLAADILCVWRRVSTSRPPPPENAASGLFDQLGLPPPPPPAPHHHPPLSLHTAKELWIFWYGEPPDLTNLIPPNLLANEGEQGSWENGLSYECRSLLFKALHNLIERCLLSRDFVRLGKWYVQPYDSNDKILEKSGHLSFSFDFFVHGESQVCASVDVRQHPAVRTLLASHIQQAQANLHSAPPVHVILAPFGLAGILTGQCLRSMDPQAQRLLEAWRHFYPIDKCLDNPDIPPIVEVVVTGGLRMHYPSCYVLITDLDDSTASLMAGVQQGPVLPPPPPLTLGRGLTGSRGALLSERVWQDSCIAPSSQQSQSEEQPASGASTTAVPPPPATQQEHATSIFIPSSPAAGPNGVWNFTDPSRKQPCTCSCKLNLGTGMAGGGTDSVPLPSVGSPASVAASPMTSCGVAGSTSGPDPPMPTLSPQPPQPQLLHHDQTKAAPTPSDFSAPKSVSSISNQMLSPYGGDMVKCLSVEGSSNKGTPPPMGRPRPSTPPSTQAPPPQAPSALLKRPNLSTLDYDDPSISSEIKLSSLLYDYSSLDAWLNHPVKRVKQQPSNQHHQSTGVSSSVQPSNDLSSAPQQLQTVFKQEPTPTQSPANASVDGYGGGPGDPYDFDEDLGSYKRQALAAIKEEDTKPHLTNGGALSSLQSKMNNENIFTSEGLPVSFNDLDRIFEQPDEPTFDSLQVTTPPSSNKPEDPTGVVGGGPGGISGTLSASNCTGGSSGPGSSVTVLSSGGGGGGMLGASRSVGSVLRPEELSKMFPTPPSLEHHPVTSPLTLPPLGDPPPPPISNSMDCNTGNSASANASTVGSPTQEPIVDWSYVYKPPEASKFVGSTKYSPLVSLPSHLLPPITLSGEIMYKPSWATYQDSSSKSNQQQQRSNTSSSSVNGGAGSGGNTTNGSSTGAGPVVVCSGNSTPVSRGRSITPVPGPGSGGGMVSSAGPGSVGSSTGGGIGGPGSVGGPPSAGGMMDCRGMSPAWAQQQQIIAGGRHPPPYSPASAASATSAAAQPQSHYPKAEPPQTPNHSPPLPEADSLVVTVLLTDSALNIIRDHNFDSCTLCVCNAGHKVVGNIRGSDAGSYLSFGGGVGAIGSSNSPFMSPSPHQLAATDDDPVRCNCGFSAVVNRRLSHKSGLFAEDELDITGVTEDIERESTHLTGVIMELMREHCIGSMSTSNAIFRAAAQYRPLTPVPIFNLLSLSDGTALVALALDHARISSLHTMCKMEIESSSNCMGARSGVHRWAYLRARSPPSNQDIIRVMKQLQPLLQDAIQKKCGTKLWEAPIVSGPLTWRQFHRLALRGTEDRCGPQPIPPILVGRDKDWLSMSPYSLHLWEKLLLEPYSYSRDVAYIVVAPENDFIVTRVKMFFKELSSMYETCKLGKHCPITKLMGDGILRVGKSASAKLGQNQPVDEWFHLLKDSNTANMFKLYAQVCRHILVSQLSQLTLDTSLFEPNNNTNSAVLSNKSNASGGNTTNNGSSSERTTSGCSPISEESSLGGSNNNNSGTGSNNGANRTGCGDASASSTGGNGEEATSSGGETPGGNSSSSYASPTVPSATTPTHSAHNNSRSSNNDDDDEPPMVIIYLVEPFSIGSDNPELQKLSCIAMLRIYQLILQNVPESLKANLQLQIVSLESIIELGRSSDSERRTNHMRSLALSIFTQTRRMMYHTTTVKALTGFGTAATNEMFLNSKDEKNKKPYKVYQPAYILAPKQQQRVCSGGGTGGGGGGGGGGGSGGGAGEEGVGSGLGSGGSVLSSFSSDKCSILYVSYCLSEDQRWLLAAATDDLGLLLETIAINIHVPNRSRRRKASPRRHALTKLMDFILGIMSKSVIPWRLVVGRVGRIGHGELKGWSWLLSKKQLLKASKQLKDMCTQCSVLYPNDVPCILSACLVSMEPDSALRLMPDQVTPDERFTQASNKSHLSTPQDVTATHILVFPTSATTQSSQSAFQETNLNGPELGDDELLMVLDDDMPEDMNDFNEIFSWTAEADVGPGGRSPGSPGRGGRSAPASPTQQGRNAVGGPMHSPYGSTGTGSGNPQGEEVGTLLQQPLALGFLVSTAPTGRMPRWFWSACPHLEPVCPAFLKNALHLHSASIQQNSDELLQNQSSAATCHPLDSQYTTDVLRYVLEGYNALSWLVLDSNTHDRQSCLPVHMQVLMQLYNMTSALT